MIEFRVTALAGPRLLLGLACLIGLGLGSSCNQTRQRPEPGEPVRVGFSLDSLVVERWNRDLEVFSQAVKDLGGELVLALADQDAQVQEAQIRDLANQDIDVLVVVPNDAERLSRVIAEVKAKGIPVLSYDRLVRNASVDLYVSFDNEKVGTLLAEALVRTQPKGRLLILNGPQSDNNARMLNLGIKRALEPRLAARTWEIGAEIWPESWDSDPVKQQLEALVASQPEFTGIIAGNDMLAEVAIAVLTENRLITTVRVVGQDADLAACQRIAEGTQLATVYKPIERLARSAAGFAIMLAHGEPFTTEATIYDGSYQVPYLRLEPILVTKEQLGATVIKDGFHKAEEVYRNVAP